MKKYFFLFVLFTAVFAQKNISIDFGDVIDTMKAELFGGIKGPGTAAEYLRATGMKYIRTHDYHGPADYCSYSDFWNTDSSGEFTTINEDFDPNDPDDYNWLQTDMKVASILDGGLDVYFRLGVSSPTSSPEIYDPPVDSYDDTLSFSRFASLCKHTAMHYNDGWADGFHYGIEYFELWCEPGGDFWDGSKVQFYHMFKYVSDTMKSYDPSIKIGGPGLVAGAVVTGNTRYREEFLAFMDSTDTQLDFYSWHLAGLKNPQSIASYADTFRNMLDSYGFHDTESHIVIITTPEDTIRTAYSAKGAAHYASCAITIQRSSVDKIFWYPYIFMLLDHGDTVYTQTANALKAFHLMQNETPLVVNSTGDETVPQPFDRDTTNFRTLAAKSVDGDKIFILVSNSKSRNEDYRITIDNLLWDAGDTVLLIKNVIKDTLNFIESSETLLYAGDSLVLEFDSLGAPSVLFLRLVNLSMSAIANGKPKKYSEIIRIMNNPFKNACKIFIPFDADMEIYDLRGRIVYKIPSHSVPLLIGEGSKSPSPSGVPTGRDRMRGFVWTPDEPISSGIYLVRVKTENGETATRKIIYLK